MIQSYSILWEFLNTWPVADWTNFWGCSSAYKAVGLQIAGRGQPNKRMLGMNLFCGCLVTWGVLPLAYHIWVTHVVWRLKLFSNKSGVETVIHSPHSLESGKFQKLMWKSLSLAEKKCNQQPWGSKQRGYLRHESCRSLPIIAAHHAFSRVLEAKILILLFLVTPRYHVLFAASFPKKSVKSVKLRLAVQGIKSFHSLKSLQGKSRGSRLIAYRLRILHHSMWFGGQNAAQRLS